VFRIRDSASLNLPLVLRQTVKTQPLGSRVRRSRQPKKPVRRERTWFERNVAEQIAELAKLPVDRQERLRRELGERKGKS
jgi:hypothetical protein